MNLRWRTLRDNINSADLFFVERLSSLGGSKFIVGFIYLFFFTLHTTKATIAKTRVNQIVIKHYCDIAEHETHT